MADRGGLMRARLPERIGPAGALARVRVGLTFIALALVWRDPTWRDAVLGLVVMPGAAVALAHVRARREPHPARETGPLGHAHNVAVLIPLFALPPTASVSPG